MLQMRARGFALRDAFPDVLKGLITAEEAQDMPVEEKDITPPKQFTNPLDAIPELSVSEPEILEVPAEKCVENTTVEVAMEVLATEMAEEVSEPLQKPGTFRLNIPGKEPMFAPSIDDWMQSYNEMADKVARSKLSREVKASKIGEFNTLNADVLGMLTAVQKAGMTANKQKRRAMLDAS
jgi:hypothetical protein